VARTPKAPKILSHAARTAREQIAHNLSRAIEGRYPDLAKSAAYRKIEKATGISLSTVQRTVDADTGATVDTLADLAHHLGTTVQALTAQIQPPPSPSSDSSPALLSLRRRRARGP